MAVQGIIAERAKDILPSTWDMLSKLPYFGDEALRRAVDAVKAMVFGEVVPPPSEVQYPVLVVDYVAKLVALDLITPGIDSWRAEGPISVSATGTNENTTYSDPVAALEALRKDLLDETRKMWPLVNPLITYSPISVGPRAISNTINEEFLTPSPQEFGRPYRVTDRS